MTQLNSNYTTNPPVPFSSRLTRFTKDLAVVSATTTNANDSIKITHADGSSLSDLHFGTVTLPDPSNAGRSVTFRVTADVTILLTGAHWGADTHGDLTGFLLRVLAINDNGTLRWGVTPVGGRHTLLTTDTNATPSNVSQPEYVLCNVAVGSATNTCAEVTFFRSNFDDTGGAAENLWANQTGVGDFVMGESADGKWMDVGQTGIFTGFSANPTIAFYRVMMIGRQVFLKQRNSAAGTSDNTVYQLLSPFKARLLEQNNCTEAKDNSADLFANGPAMVRTAADSRTLNFYKDLGSTAWTNAGTKFADFNINFEVGPAASFID